MSYAVGTSTASRLASLGPASREEGRVAGTAASSLGPSGDSRYLRRAAPPSSAPLSQSTSRSPSLPHGALPWGIGVAGALRPRPTVSGRSWLFCLTQQQIGQDKPDALPTPGSGQVDGRSGSGRVVVTSTAHWTRRTWKGSRGTNRHTLSGMFTSAARCRRSATYRMKRDSPSASLWSAFPGSTGKTKRSSSTAEQRPETGGRQPL